MESTEQREERKNSTKALIIFGLVFVIALAAFGAYKAGIIPGLGEGSKVAKQLKADIEASRGNAIKSKVIAFYQGNPDMPQEAKDVVITSINKDMDMDFQYTGLKTSSGDGKGTVEIESPKLIIKSIAPESKTSPVELQVGKLFISRDVKDASHYFFRSEGNIDVYADPAHSGTSSKVLTIAADLAGGEFKMMPDKASGYMKYSAKNLKVIEGHGNTVLATIGDIYVESNRQKAAGKADMSAKLNLKNIAPGDTLKIMIGAIDPISINLDYAYKGDDYNEQLTKLMQHPQLQEADKLKAMEDPNYQPAPTSDIPAEFKPFDGNGKLHDFSVMMGDAGVSVNADVTFSKDNPKIIPKGTASFKLSQYDKLITYFAKFYPVPREVIDKSIQFLSEVGQNSGGNIIIDAKFDGTENVLIGGKTTDEVKAIAEKYYPREASPYAPPLPSDGAKPAAPAPVQGKPIVEHETKI